MPLIEDEPPITLPRVALRCAPVHRARLGLGRNTSSPCAAAQDVAAPGERDVQPEIAVPAARLEHQHADRRILARSGGQRAAGRAGADDDVIEACACGHRSPHEIRVI